MEGKIKSDIGELSPRKYFDKQSATWQSNIQPGDSKRLYEILSEKVEGIKRPVLDVGCGTGILLPVLSKLKINVSPVYEVDLSFLMLMNNRESHRKAIAADHIQADVAYLPFTSDYFRTILSFAAFAHFALKNQVLEEFWRVLSPGGIFVILHLMGCDNLNMMHARVGGAVKNDHLPPIDILSSELENKNFRILHQEDLDNIYLLIARK